MKSGGFIKIFFGIVFGYFLTVAALNFTLDPFAVFLETKDSPSNPDISAPYNSVMMVLGKVPQEGDYRFVAGDSRARELTSRRFADNGSAENWRNFFVGGSDILEVIDLVRTAVNKNQPDEVVIVMPMRMFIERRTNRVPEAQQLRDSKPLYLTNSLVSRASIANLVYMFSGKVLKTERQGGDKDEAWRYWIDHANLKAATWTKARTVRHSIHEVVAELRDKGVTFRIVLPPIHDDLLSVYSGEMPDIYADYLAFFGAFPETLNCTVSDLTADKDLFTDPYHYGAEIADLMVMDILDGAGRICRPA